MNNEELQIQIAINICEEKIMNAETLAETRKAFRALRNDVTFIFAGGEIYETESLK